MVRFGYACKAQNPGVDHSTRGGPLQLHYGVIDIGPHDLPLRKRWRPSQPGALEGHHCRATRAVAHDEIRLEIEWFRGGGPCYRRSWKLILSAKSAEASAWARRCAATRQRPEHVRASASGGRTL